MRSWLRFRRVGIVLIGHGLTLPGNDRFRAPYHDDFGALTEAVGMYEDWSFQFISMEELLEISKNNFQFDKNWIHLTFDDGFESIYTRAYPYLRQRQIPFSLFISTHHIESAERFYGYRIRCSMLKTKRNVNIPGLELSLPAEASKQERRAFGDTVTEVSKRMSKSQVVDLMAYIDLLLSPQEWEEYDALYSEDQILTVDQVRELASDKLVHIGSHNHNHVVLNRNVSEEDITFEMQESKEWLQRNLGVTEITYAYPNGSIYDFSASSMRICEELGYELAFTSIDDFVTKATDRYQIPRMWLATSSNTLSKRLLRFLLPYRIIAIARILRSIFGRGSSRQGPIKRSRHPESTARPATESIDI